MKLTRSDPQYWDGTLLKCPGCRCKFPFSAQSHEFRCGEPAKARNSPVRADAVARTRCPQCHQPVMLT